MVPFFSLCCHNYFATCKYFLPPYFDDENKRIVEPLPDSIYKILPLINVFRFFFFFKRIYLASSPYKLRNDF